MVGGSDCCSVLGRNGIMEQPMLPVRIFVFSLSNTQTYDQSNSGVDLLACDEDIDLVGHLAQQAICGVWGRQMIGLPEGGRLAFVS
eukprot:7145151-Ditylum_brightwellii.AAC.1